MEIVRICGRGYNQGQGEQILTMARSYVRKTQPVAAAAPILGMTPVAAAPTAPVKRKRGRPARATTAAQSGIRLNTTVGVTAGNFNSICTQVLNNPAFWGQLKTQIIHSEMLAPDIFATMVRDEKCVHALQLHHSSNVILGNVLDVVTRTPGFTARGASA
jgi:hypothetical protein